MFSIDKITALITNEQIQFAPWPYLVVEKMINNDTALIIHNRLKTGVNWELDSRVSSNIWLDKDVDKEIKMIFEPLASFCESRFEGVASGYNRAIRFSVV